MNAKQSRFVAEYLKDSNATQAAIRAGYSKKTAGQQGHELLKKPDISNAVRAGAIQATEESVKAAQAVGITPEVIMQCLWANYQAAFKGQPMVDRYGNPTGATQQKIGDANRALELLGKQLGMFADVKVNTTPDAWAELQGYLARHIEQRTNKPH